MVPPVADLAGEPQDAGDGGLDAQRSALRGLLQGGLATAWKQRAYTDVEVRRVVAALQDLAPDDMAGRLRVAGFTLAAYVGAEDPEIEQACSTCMYFETHRRYCNLPELKLGVEPEWSCILWRV